MQFWERDIGATWLSFERKKIIEFANIRPREKVFVSGYVKSISDSVFALLPTLFSNQIHLLCINYADVSPAENSYISISGETKFDILRQNPRSPSSTVFDAKMAVIVNEWKADKPNLELPKSYLKFKDFEEDLTRRFEGLEPQLRDFLAFTAVSAPPFYESTGGINLTMYDSTKNQSYRTSISRKISQELSLAIPEGIGSTQKIATPYGSFDIGYKYAFLAEDADKTLSTRTEQLLAHKAPKLLPNCTETSLSLFSGKNKPVTIEDLPCCRTDIPTVVPEETDFVSKKRSIDPFDAFNFIICNHFKTPVFEDLPLCQTRIVDSLEKLASDYNLDQRHLTKFGFLDANYTARPMSILREGLSYARCQNIDVINCDLSLKVFNDFFKWNFEYVYDVWDDLLNTPLVGHRAPDSLRIKFREIIRIVRKYHSSGTPGAARQDIISEAKTTPFETQLLLDECSNAGIIYQPVEGFYRLTRDDA